jgi:hypothetical protein
MLLGCGDLATSPEFTELSREGSEHADEHAVIPEADAALTERC